MNILMFRSDNFAVHTFSNFLIQNGNFAFEVISCKSHAWHDSPHASDDTQTLLKCTLTFHSRVAWVVGGDMYFYLQTNNVRLPTLLEG